jgi:hypothetical protein
LTNQRLSAALDIGEEKGDGARRKCRHGGAPAQRKNCSAIVPEPTLDWDSLFAGTPRVAQVAP